jgi:spore germination cell wall hydrolase CwlJ-like protein
MEALFMMGTFEHICNYTAIASILYVAMVWQPTSVTTQPSTPTQMEPLTKSEKQILCNAWEDCKLLTELVVYEARSEPLEGKRLVAKTVLNRVEHKSWPDTIKGVIYEPKQFSYIEDMHKQRTPTDGDWLEASSVALDVLHGYIDVESTATFYHERRIKPFWADHKEMVADVGNHKFYTGAK